MKWLLALITVFAVSTVQATTPMQELFLSLDHCLGPIAHSSDWMAVTQSYRDVVVIHGNSTEKFKLPVSERVMDLLIDGDRLIVLRPAHIEVWNLETQELIHRGPSHAGNVWEANGTEARDLALWNDHVIIAHGRLGYSVFSLSENRVLATHPLFEDQAPKESEVTGVVVIGNEAIFTATGFTLPGGRWGKESFRGFSVVDLLRHQEIHRAGGLDPASRGLQLLGETLVVDFGGHFHTFRLKDVKSRKTVRFQRTVWGFPNRLQLRVGFELAEGLLWGCAAPNVSTPSRPVTFEFSTIGL